MSSDSMIYTIGTALNRAQDNALGVQILVEGQWLGGQVLAVDGHGVVIHSATDVRARGDPDGQRVGGPGLRTAAVPRGDRTGRPTDAGSARAQRLTRAESGQKVRLVTSSPFGPCRHAFGPPDTDREADAEPGVGPSR